MKTDTDPSELRIAEAKVDAPMYLAGEWVNREAKIEVRNPFDDELIGTVPRATSADIQTAVRAAAAALKRDFPAHARYEVLMTAAERIESRHEAYAWTIAAEGSKAISEARWEPRRAAQILRLSAEEGRRLSGETLPFDIRAGSENREGYYFRFPVGVVGAITPFNDPLAMAAHKTAPAIAAGNAVVLKPGSATPYSALGLARDLLEAGLPPDRLSVVTGSGQEVGEALAAAPEVRVLSFTGGVETGDRLTRIAGIKKLSMELGSNSPVIVNRDAGLEQAIPAISDGAFAQAGQNCLGVQRVLVHEEVYDVFAKKFVHHVSQLVSGSSLNEKTDVCTMINETEAIRVETWVNEAVEQGARLLIGGRREGTLYPPTVLENVPEGSKLDCQEVYGPVVSLYRFASLDEAIQKANQVDYGLHAAVFTENLRDAYKAIRGLEVGGIIVNDSTNYRLDVMPFGGTKLSGIGREGIRFGILQMTETRVVCFNL
jgi:glyceraldehyde-3-phosphate dehydrogenase (NADP+)